MVHSKYKCERVHINYLHKRNIVYLETGKTIQQNLRLYLISGSVCWAYRDQFLRLPPLLGQLPRDNVYSSSLRFDDSTRWDFTRLLHTVRFLHAGEAECGSNHQKKLRRNLAHTVQRWIVLCSQLPQVFMAHHWSMRKTIVVISDVTDNNNMSRYYYRRYKNLNKRKQH